MAPTFRTPDRAKAYSLSLSRNPSFIFSLYPTTATTSTLNTTATHFPCSTASPSATFTPSSVSLSRSIVSSFFLGLPGLVSLNINIRPLRPATRGHCRSLFLEIVSLETTRLSRGISMRKGGDGRAADQPSTPRRIQADPWLPFRHRSLTHLDLLDKRLLLLLLPLGQNPKSPSTLLRLCSPLRLALSSPPISSLPCKGFEGEFEHEPTGVDARR